MEFSEKMQQLRKQRGLTQEALAEALYVSRTAISKWESGRGYPNLDSLKAIAIFFSVSIDALLSDEAFVSPAEAQPKAHRSLDSLFGLLDCSRILFFFLPIFGQEVQGTVMSASLLALTQVQPYIKVVFCVMTACIVMMGIALLALQRWQHTGWTRWKYRGSVAVDGLAMGVFIICRQPYATAILCILLLIKGWTWIKRR